MISRRDAMAALASTPLLGAAASKPEKAPKFPPPALVPFRIGENTPWTTVTANNSKPFPFVLSLISSLLHCDPSLTHVLGATKRQGSDGYLVTGIVVGGAVGVDGMGLIPYANYYARRMVAGTFELGIFDCVHIEWDKLALAVIYDPKATAPAGYTDFERPSSEAAQFPTVYGTVNGKKVSLLINTVTPGGVVLRGTPENEAMSARAARKRENLGRNGQPGGSTFVAEALTLGPAEIPNALITVAPTPDLPWVGESHGKPPSFVDGTVGFDIAKRVNMFRNRLTDSFSGKANARIGELQMDDRVGVNLYAYGDGYRIGEIDTSGPAAKAGLRNNDWITAYDGPRGLPGLPWAFTQKAGTPVEFEVERVAGKPFRVTVVTEDRV